MKLLIPAAALLSVVLLSSCSSMYRSGQTPDDVYYSPGRSSDVARTQTGNDDEYGYTNPDDNYLRQKVQNRSRWSTIDDADYWYSYNRPYSNLYGSGFNTFGSPYLGNSLSIGFGNYYGLGGFGSPYGFNNFGGYPFWNTFNYGYPDYTGYGGYGYGGLYGHGYYGGGYGGYYPGTVIIGGGGLRSNTGPKPYMGGFTNNNYNNSNTIQRRNDSRLGSFMRNTFGNGNNNSSNPHPGTYDNNSGRPARTFTPSSTPSYSPSSSRGSVGGSSGSSGGGSGTSSRPGRGGR